MQLASGDSSRVVLSGVVCFKLGTPAGSVRVWAGLSPHEDSVSSTWAASDTAGVEVWAGPAAPGEVIPWTLEVLGAPGTESWALATPFDNGERDGGGELLYYGFRSKRLVSASVYEGLGWAEYEVLLREAGLEGATTEQIRAASPDLYWRLTNNFQTPGVEHVPIMGSEGQVVTTYETLPEFMVAQLPDSLRIRYNNPTRALERAHIAEMGGNPDLVRPQIRLKPEAYRVIVPEEVQCSADPALPQGARYDAYIRCLHRLADWYRERGLVDTE
jgi:hypothetical protein